MKLSQLLKGLVSPSALPTGDPGISGITQDSRRVEKGFLFVAISGSRQDGRQFVSEAAQKGAVAVVLEKSMPALKVHQVIVEDPRKTLADLSARFYGEPTRRLKVFGITGTNGKTTLTYLLESILKESGRRPGVIGTVNYRYGSSCLPALTTTPESVDLQRIFSEMLGSGVTDVVMEVSSHALAQGRVRNIHFDGVAFTNLSRDHLDYHRDLADYFDQKRKLFSEFLPASAKKNKFAVINLEDEWGRKMDELCTFPKIRVGLSESCDVSVVRHSLTASGIEATLRLDDEELEISSPLVGSFNLENILVAAGLSYGAGFSLDSTGRGIKALRGVPGRIEKIPNERGLSIFVDYAHTPEALKTVGLNLRRLSKGRLMTVFGCGGDRDRGKRPEMGREAVRFSDLVVVTSDNPRTEDPEKILDDIEPGLKEGPLASRNIFRIVDRREAIRKALERAEPGDTILVAGKGHEDYQIIGTNKIHFDDREVIHELLSSLP